MDKRRVVIVVGSGPATSRTICKVGEMYPDKRVVQVSYGVRDRRVRMEDYLKLRSENSEEIIFKVKGLVGNARVEGIVNRVDSHIVLYSMLVDEFGVVGSGYKEVMQGRDKSVFHESMVAAGLGKYRPYTDVLDKSEFLGGYKRDYPYVLKPTMGSKSRGVYVVESDSDYKQACKYLGEHFKNSRSYRGYEGERKVMAEEYIGSAKQLTITCYVDGVGKLVSMQSVDVLVGREVGQNHQQLVYRSMPSLQSAKLVKEAEDVLQGFVRYCGIRGVFLHPEFLVKEDRLYLVEVNIRVGGFRGEILKYTNGLDIDEMVIRLAMGETLNIEQNDSSKGCVAVEVWEDNSGVLRELNEPSGVMEYKQFINKGEKYIAPPESQIPVARFYVVGEGNQLERAKMIRQRMEVEIL